VSTVATRHRTDHRLDTVPERPLTDGELHRLGVLVNQRLDIGSILGADVDTSTLVLIRRLIGTERARRLHGGT